MRKNGLFIILADSYARYEQSRQSVCRSTLIFPGDLFCRPLRCREGLRGFVAVGLRMAFLPGRWIVPGRLGHTHHIQYSDHDSPLPAAFFGQYSPPQPGSVSHRHHNSHMSSGPPPRNSWPTKNPRVWEGFFESSAFHSSIRNMNR